MTEAMKLLCETLRLAGDPVSEQAAATIEHLQGELAVFENAVESLMAEIRTLRDAAEK